MRNGIFARAIEEWREVRDAYELAREAAYARAEDELSGRLLNLRGIAAGIDPYSLFMGTETRAVAYASEELLDHWSRHPRVTYAQFEAESAVYGEAS